MKHATTRLLFAYWDRLRGDRSAPERAEIRPGDIRQVLADTFILGQRADRSVAFRLAGTRCSALFGRELRDVPFEALLRGDSGEASALLDPVLDGGSALVAGLTGTNAEGGRLGLELLLVPLRHRGTLGTRALGALSPGSLPSWIGLVPLESIETQSIRIVHGERLAVPPVAPGEPTPRRRPRLTLLDGGLRR